MADNHNSVNANVNANVTNTKANAKDTQTKRNQKLNVPNNNNEHEIKICIRDVCKIENIVAKYIYKKYINISNNLADSAENINDDDDDENDAISKQLSAKYIYSLKIKNDANYKKYLNTIFQKGRAGIITQDESLTNELHNIAIADSKLENDMINIKNKKQIICVSRFARSTVKSFPDIMRCNFIIKNKNKLRRCGCKLISTNCEYCYLHALMPNIYWDRYCNLLENVD
jgi:hypothetical protein